MNFLLYVILAPLTTSQVTVTTQAAKTTETATTTQATTLSQTTTTEAASTTKEALSANIKLLELDTDFVATRKENNSKFLEIDDAFTIGASDTHDHKIIEINIIDKKDNNNLPSKLFITTKVAKEIKKYKPEFTSSVKKDGKNLQPPTSKIVVFNETFQEMSNETSTQDYIILNPKIKLNNPKNGSEVIPDRVFIPRKESKFQAVLPMKFSSEELEENVKETNQYLDLGPDQMAVTTDFGGEFTDTDELNSEVPPSHKHRGRLLTRSPHHNYYPYFFSRVLG